MYDFYLGKVLLPVAPKKLQIKVGNNNKTYTLINEGEINILKEPGLTEIDFEILLPNLNYGFARYKNGYKPASHFLEKLEKFKINKSYFQFIVVRQFPSGKSLNQTNLTVSLEDYSIIENTDNGFDTMVNIKLKQYKPYGTKKIQIQGNIVSAEKERALSENKPSIGTYKVKAGDSLWKISASYLGNGARWKEIYNINKHIIGDDPNKIYVGQTLTIP